MPMGKSGGRSSRNRLGRGAEERATQRQREGIDPPGFSPGQVEPEPTVLDRAAWWVVDLVKPRPGDFWAAFLGTIFALVVAKWFGLI